MEDKDFETLEDLDINDENTREEETNLDEENKEDVNVIKEQKIDDIPKEAKVEALPNEIGRVSDVGVQDVTIKVTSSLAFEKNLIDHHVIFETNSNQKIVGTVISLNSEIGSIKLIGEINGPRFIPGVLVKPSIGNVCFVATDEEVRLIISGDQNNFMKRVLIGNMPLYNNTPAYVSTNTFFSNHFAIFGNTGSGKSCGVARLFQNIFFNNTQTPRNACIFIFDAYGEYESALSVQNSQVFFKKYSTNVRQNPQNLIKLPLWLLDIDDFALLLEVDDPTQLPIIEKALRLVTIFSGSDEETKIYKNDIIAKAILEVLYSGGAASQIHDQIFAILTSFNTEDLNLETPIVQPGYTRSLRQCLIIDKEGKIGEMQLVTEFIKKFINPDLKLELPDGTIPFTLENLRDAFDFALISEGTLKSDKMYDKANVLKVRLDSLIKGEYAQYFKMDKYVDKNTFIKELITASNGGRAQIININISYLDDRLAKTICKIYAKLLFDFTSKLQQRGSFPVHLILEEAHRYVQQDSDTKILGYNIFDRIAKEGRKYGVLLGLISQRPSEMSETVLSQCSNFLIFKMQHPRDVSFIRQMVPFITDEIVEKMKGLQPGTCVVFGSAFKLPTIVKMEMPNPQPMSQNVDVSRLWY
jgi:DNA helicase HerA-like ATPase